MEESLPLHLGSLVIQMLRKLYAPYETNTPDLWFLADLIDGKFKKTKGRPRGKKTVAGIKQRLAAETVAFILDKEKVTQEDAFERAAKKFFICLKVQLKSTM